MDGRRREPGVARQLPRRPRRSTPGRLRGLRACDGGSRRRRARAGLRQRREAERGVRSRIVGEAAGRRAPPGRGAALLRHGVRRRVRLGPHRRPRGLRRREPVRNGLLLGRPSGEGSRRRPRLRLVQRPGERVLDVPRRCRRVRPGGRAPAGHGRGVPRRLPRGGRAAAALGRGRGLRPAGRAHPGGHAGHRDRGRERGHGHARPDRADGERLRRRTSGARRPSRSTASRPASCRSLLLCRSTTRPSTGCSWSRARRRASPPCARRATASPTARRSTTRSTARACPDETQGFGYVDLQRAVPLFLGFAEAGDAATDEARGYLEPLQSLVFYSDQDDETASFTFFVGVE